MSIWFIMTYYTITIKDHTVCLMVRLSHMIMSAMKKPLWNKSLYRLADEVNRLIPFEITYKYGKLTIACSILLSIATTLAPDAL